MSDLADRQRNERAFHDRWASTVDPAELDPRRIASCPTTPETTYALRALGSLGGKRVLDLGCGYGETTAWLALRGAHVEAVDISPGMVQLARQLCERHGVDDRVGFYVAPGEQLPFADGSFDVVFGHDVLHHLDLERSRDEIHRLLVPGGRAVFVEPLGHNPIINLFREGSPQTRTPDEVPLSFADIGRLGRGFVGLRHREFQMATLAIFLWFYCVERVDPNRERYWKRLVVRADRYRRAFGILNAIDRTLLAVCPPLGRLCRMTVIVLER